MSTDVLVVNTIQSRDDDAELSGLELLETARRTVRHLRGSRNVPQWTLSSVDDTVSDVVEACLVAQRNGTSITGRYVFGVARNLVTRDRELCSADARALRILAERVATLEQEQGHEASAGQVDALAARIIDEWDRPSRRPTRGFHLRRVVVSLDTLPGCAPTLVDLVGPSSDPELLASASERFDELIDAARRAGDKAEHSALRRACWDTLARVYGAPLVRGPVTKKRVTRARSVIIRHPEGPQCAINLALRHARHDMQSTLTDALFTPFDGVDRQGRLQIVDLLDRYRPHAVGLWSGALSASSAAFYRAV